MVHVILPAYNEEEALAQLLPALAEFLVADGLDYQVTVVDDGSTDGTAEVVQRLSATMPLRLVKHEANQGLAAAIRSALIAVRQSVNDSDIVIAMDADNTHVPGLIPQMVRRIRAGADVVIASRFQPGSRVVGVPWHRQVLSWGASLLFRILLPIPGVRDYTCGYRAYRGKVVRDAFERYGDKLITQEGFSCMVDLLLRVGQMPVVITEVPMILRYDLKPGASKMRVAATMWETVKLLIRRRLRLQ